MPKQKEIPSEEISELEGTAPQLQLENSRDTPLFLDYMERILSALSDLQDFDAFEVFVRTEDSKRVQKLFHTGNMEAIWSEDAYQEGSLLHKSLYRGEQRMVNLPNRRLDELGRRLKEKAFGQVLCLPINQNSRPVGMICAAHTRRKFFTDKELQFLEMITEWIAGMMSYEQKKPANPRPDHNRRA